MFSEEQRARGNNDAVHQRRYDKAREKFPLLLLLSPLLLAGTVRTDVLSAEGPTFTEPITNVTVSVGREAVLTCAVADLLTYKVAWLRVDTQTILTIANHVITKNHRILVTHSEHKIWYLHIRHVRESDRGYYMCQINTDPMKSQIGYLEVVVPPGIDDNLTSTDMSAREGNNVTLRCVATGSPTPNITWRREDGESITIGTESGVTSVEGSILNITRVNRFHMGAYLCIASNGVPPIVSKRIMLTVHFAPMIEIQNQLVGAQEGQEITLECDSEAHPKSINYWTTENNIVISESKKYKPLFMENSYKVKMRLTINSVNKSDYCTYKCISKNSLGETDGSIKLYHIPTTTTQPKPTTTTPMPTVKRVEKQERSREKMLSSLGPHSNEIADGSLSTVTGNEDSRYSRAKVEGRDFDSDVDDERIGSVQTVRVGNKDPKGMNRDVGLRRIDNTAQSMSSTGATVNSLVRSRAAICIILLTAFT